MTSTTLSGQEPAALYRFTDRLFRAESERDVYEASLDAIAEAMGCQRAAILRFNERNVMRFVAWRGLSDGYRIAVDGHSPWTAGQRDVEPLTVSNIEDAGESEAITSVILGENIRGLAFIPLTMSGGVVGKFMVYYEDPHAFTQHEIDLAVTIGRQMGFGLERLAAAEILRRERERFEAVVESIPVMIKLYDPQSGELMLNSAFSKVLGWTGDEARGVDLMAEFFPSEPLREKVRSFMDECPEGWLDTPMVTRMGALVETSWANIRLSDGTRVGIGLDITERKRALERQQLLLNEMDHRIRNLFTLAGGIVSLSGRGQSDAAALVADVRERLAALARAHAMTVAGADGASEQSAGHLHALITAILSPYGVGQAARYSIVGRDLALSSEAVTSLALLFYEFATNAAKYGALSSEQGRIQVECAARDGQMSVTWRELGGPHLGKEQGIEGFGSRLQQASAKQMGADLRREWRREGLVVKLRVPIERLARDHSHVSQRLAS